MVQHAGTQAWHGMARRAMAWHGMAWHGGPWMERVDEWHGISKGCKRLA